MAMQPDLQTNTNLRQKTNISTNPHMNTLSASLNQTNTRCPCGSGNFKVSSMDLCVCTYVCAVHRVWWQWKSSCVWRCSAPAYCPEPLRTLPLSKAQQDDFVVTELEKDKEERGRGEGRRREGVKRKEGCYLASFQGQI